MKVVVIGAGIGGLATAVRLAVAGHSVRVFEQNSYPGGKLSVFEDRGYRFDAGPSLFTMPQYVDELFRLAGKSPTDYLQYEALDTVCHYFWEDGTQLHAFADPKAFDAEVAKKMGVPAGKMIAFLENCRKKYTTSGYIFLENSLHKWSTWLSKKVANALPFIPSLGVFSTMHEEHTKFFEDPRMIQLLDRFATYNGSNPYRAPGLLSLIPHFEHGMGAYLPKGGMHDITQSVYQLALDLGVQFHFNAPVEKILTEGTKTTGVIAKQQTWPAEIIVSNMDVWFTFRKLLAEAKAPERALQQERSTSALIFYWGVKKSFPALNVHNILFSKDYEAEFRLLDEGKVSEDPTVYINITSKKIAADAPTDCENWFILVNVPPNTGQDWEVLSKKVRQSVLSKLERMLGENVASLIEVESQLDPVTIEQKTASYQGSLYGTSSNSRYAAFLRHPNFSKQWDNLYFVGGSVHPGGGIPLALLSAKIASDLIQKAK